MRFFRRLTGQLSFSVLVAALPLAALVAYQIYVDAQRAHAQAIEFVQNVARDITDRTSTFVQRIAEQAAYLSMQPRVRALDAGNCDPLISEFQRMKPLYLAIILVDRRGQLVCASLDETAKGTDYSDREWFRNALDGKGFRIAEPITGRVVKQLAIPFTIPVSGENGAMGVLNFGISVREIGRVMQTHDMPEGSALTLISADGTIIARSLEPEKWIGVDARNIPVFAHQLQARQGIVRAPGADGVERIHAFRTMPDSGWLLSVAIPAHVVMADLRKDLAYAVAAAILVIAFAAAMVLYMARRMRASIHALEHAAQATAQHQFRTRVPEEGPEELANVARAFNRMLDALSRSDAQVKARTAELAGVNKELEAFAYSVSHDLRAPLRAIDGYSQALLEDHGDALNAEGKDYLQRLHNATTRMTQLIEDLLNLSRLSRSEMSLSTVDLSGLSERILRDLEQTTPGRATTVAIKPGIVARGDPRLLECVMQNLLSNAWKFTSKKRGAHIEVTAETKDAEIECAVRDDGAGFDMAYADKLFAPFQRLHTAAEFPGTGIGLASVKRIIARHGGRVWAEAAPQHGATFHFTLPAGSV